METHMRKLTLDDPETRSADLVSENVTKLKELFPEAITEGKIDFDVLKQVLGGAMDEREEKYGLNWHGKRKARQLALTPSTGTLRPCPEESVDWDTTQHLFIEGDNLEVLKLLQKSYANKVKLIYIDPPYNTGKDFIYPDDFHDNIKNYLELTGQVEGSRKITSNTEASGRFHTDWLNMMYPRLKLARNLLLDDGAIFATIADHEIHNLRAIMSDVFGEENFVATVIWQKVYSPKSSAKHFSEDHDYILVFAKNADDWRPRLLPRTPEMEARYLNPDSDPRGPWKPGDLSARNYYGDGTYPITCPSGRVISGPPSGNYWRVSRTNFDRLDEDRRIWWGSDGNNIPAIKRFLSEVKAGRVPQTLWKYEEVGHTQEAKKELIAAVDFPNSDSVFETPKPTRLLRRILELATDPDEESIVLDFFAGSGTTQSAVLRQNSQDGGKRRCILVQLPEPIPEAGTHFATIADLARRRLRNEANALAEAGKNSDNAFRTFKLDTSNITQWQPRAVDLRLSLLESVEHIRDGRTENDILFEVLLKLGLDLCVPIEQKVIAGKAVNSVGGGVLIVCLAEKISRKEVEPLALGLVDWHKALAPVGETSCVFLDSAFVDDVAKSNLAAILEQHGLSKVTSL